MRVVAAVLLLVSVLHAGVWGVLRDKEPAPDFNGLLPSEKKKS
jgi:glucan 1,3-beta-glucosidase